MASNGKFLLLCAFVASTVAGIVSEQSCEKITKLSGEIKDSQSTSYEPYQKCWLLEVPKDSYVRLNIVELNLGSTPCYVAYLKVFVNESYDKYTFCYDSNVVLPKTIISLSGVNVSYSHHSVYYPSKFRILFTTESLICAEKNHFRCSPDFCIDDHQVCNGVKDCKDGSDEIGCPSLSCDNITTLSGQIYESQSPSYDPYKKCWLIEVPQDSYVRLDITDLDLGSTPCSDAYFKVLVNESHDKYTFCNDTKIDLSKPKSIISLSDVNVSYSHHSIYYPSKFHMRFTTESLACAQKNHFRCSPDFCIYDHQVCNGAKDCDNGSDELGCEKIVFPENGMDISRINAINWLKNQRTKSFGWGKNTHRAVTALYLSKAMTFQGDDLEENLIAKQLELQTAVALLRNVSDPISVNELSMFVNALAVTCQDPRHFYGYDLVQILSDRMASAKYPVPSIYLTLCNLNWTLSESDVKGLVNLLHTQSKYPFHLDVQALTIMALTCIRNTTKLFENIEYAETRYMSAVRDFAEQLPDGSFGNIYTTALLTQALISSGQGESKYWNVTAAEQYLMKQLNSSSVDFLSVYLILPILSGRSLNDIKATDCSNKRREEEKDKDISEVMEKLGGKMQVEYSLYIGDQKDIVHTMYLRMPENSSAYDVMRVAQVTDSKYKFLQRDVSGQMYVYEIAGIINDPEAGKFWLLYLGDHDVNGSKQHTYVEHYTDSPDEFILGDNDHLIMWYRTANI